MLLSAENKVAKKVGKASFTGCFRRNRVEWNAREGWRRKRKRKGRWKLDGCSTTERTARQDCIGS